MIGLPDDFLHHPGSSGGGVIQTTASEATLVCLLAARTRAIQDIQQNEPDLSTATINSRLVAYCSDQVCTWNSWFNSIYKYEFFKFEECSVLVNILVPFWIKEIAVKV